METLLWNQGLPGADRELYIGDSGEQVALAAQELRDTGVAHPRTEPARAAAPRAVALTGAALELVEENEVNLEGGIGAVLRFPAPA